MATIRIENTQNDTKEFRVTKEGVTTVFILGSQLDKNNDKAAPFVLTHDPANPDLAARQMAALQGTVHSPIVELPKPVWMQLRKDCAVTIDHYISKELIRVRV